MQTPLYNPFTNRSMIKKESEFIGREREINDILSRVRNGNSVSIVGDRRIGKSSLLYHLYLTGNRRLNDKNKEQYKFLFIDLLSPQISTPQTFSQCVLKKLNISFEIDLLKIEPLVVLEECLEKHRENGLIIILLLDEFEKLAKNRDIFSDDFFESLRSFCNGGLLTIVSTSKQTIKNILDRKGLTSPLWNIFTNHTLYEFSIDNPFNEVAFFLEYFWQGDFYPTNEEQLFLLSNLSTHPLIMQVTSYHLLHNRILILKENDLKRNIESELLSYFRTNKEKIIKWLKDETPEITEKIDWTSEWLGKQVSNIIPVLKIFTKK